MASEDNIIGQTASNQYTAQAIKIVLDSNKKINIIKGRLEKTAAQAFFLFNPVAVCLGEPS